MPRTYLQSDSGMIQDDTGRWIPPDPANKDYRAALAAQAKGDVVFQAAPVDTAPRALPVNVALLVKLIEVVKTLAAGANIPLDPKLDEFLTRARAAEPAERVRP